jgi:hypothetical protein
MRIRTLPGRHVTDRQMKLYMMTLCQAEPPIIVAPVEVAVPPSHAEPRGDNNHKIGRGGGLNEFLARLQSRAAERRSGEHGVEKKYWQIKSACPLPSEGA